ncbi:unnamed protein product [Rotaria sp. Silwood2]|nr:unnamed protein product [Rotaria sp. Silwood2]CAF3935417.1 unnamed protein product [Rotaria sp. Silwood2]
MDKKELTPTATSNSPSSSTTNKLKKPSSSSTTTTDTDSSGSTATTPSGNAMLPQRVLQNFLLIWLDSSLDKSKHDFKKSIQQLRCLVASIVVFTDTRQCINFLNEIKNEKVFMILSGSQGRRLKPRTYALSQLDSVYIFCHNQATHEEWANKISKIKGIYTRIKPIFKALQIDCERCDQAMISISFRGIDPLFMYTQLFKEVFFEIRDDDEKSIKEFVEYCRIHDDIPEDQIKKIERKYHRYSTIWWYTAPYFIYSMLNRGLRLLDVNIILKMGFFIRHLHRDIEELHREQQSITTTATNPFQVYRGQGLSVQDFEKMKQTKGGLMSFNNFLLTSRNRRISLKRFARPAALNPNSVGILFVMTIDPILCARSSTPFVDIKNVGYHKDQEEEILFSIHTIFRIDKIKRIEDKHTRRLWELTFPRDIALDSQQNLIISDSGNWRIQKYYTNNGTIITLLGNIVVYNVFIDQYDNIYYDDYSSVQKLSNHSLTVTTTTVAEDNRTQGNKKNQLNNSQGLYIGRFGTVDVSDSWNYRVIKWFVNVSEGIVVAGGNGQDAEGNQFFFVLGELNLIHQIGIYL